MVSDGGVRVGKMDPEGYREGYEALMKESTLAPGSDELGVGQGVRDRNPTS